MWTNYRDANYLYFNLTEEQKDLVYNKDILLNLKDNINQSFYVASVQKLIDKIEIASNKEEARLIALMAYELLNEDSKALITGADILHQSFVQEDGCSGSVYPSIFGIILLGACVIIIRRKRGVNNEEN